MPLDAQHGWERSEMITAGEVMERLRDDLHAHPGRPPSAAAPRPSAGWWTAARPSVGIIASVTRPVLRRLRPHPPHRRRSDPHVPVRPHRDRPARAAARRRVRRRDRRRVAPRDVGQARRARHQRPRLPAARPPDERDRRLTMGTTTATVTIRYFAAARAAAGVRDRAAGAPGRRHRRRRARRAPGAARRRSWPACSTGAASCSTRSRCATARRSCRQAPPSTCCRRSPAAERGRQRCASATTCRRSRGSCARFRPGSSRSPPRAARARPPG